MKSIYYISIGILVVGFLSLLRWDKLGWNNKNQISLSSHATASPPMDCHFNREGKVVAYQTRPFSPNQIFDEPYLHLITRVQFYSVRFHMGKVSSITGFLLEDIQKSYQNNGEIRADYYESYPSLAKKMPPPIEVPNNLGQRAFLYPKPWGNIRFEALAENGNLVKFRRIPDNIDPKYFPGIWRDPDYSEFLTDEYQTLIDLASELERFCY